VTIPDVPSAAQFRALQRQQRTEGAVAWRKWHRQFAAQTHAATELIVAEAGVRPGMAVLDLSSGVGVPALALAEAVAPGGHVTATDLIPEMLPVIDEQARARGLTNLATRPADIEALPFPDASFDVATCRFGLMFCPDVGQALREVHRVLRPGGRAAFVVWDGPDQPYFNSTANIVVRYAQLPTPPPGAPTPFRFAHPGSLSAALTAAGFAEVQEAPRTIAWAWPGSPEDFWVAQQEIGAPAWRRFYEALASECIEQINAEAVAALRGYYDGRVVDPTARVISATGRRNAER
jgi:SAM-dependent methyltransferase